MLEIKLTIGADSELINAVNRLADAMLAGKTRIEKPKRIFPQSQLYFIMGDDAFAGITTWKDFDKLGELATLVVVSRYGNAPEVPATLSPSVNLLEISALPISSTQCRERIENGLSLDGLVPDKVAQYIEEHQLYRRNA